MAEWYRIFASGSAVPEPAAILEHLTRFAPVTSDVLDGESGWCEIGLLVEGIGTLKLERFQANEEGIRAELNSWAAWLETCEHNPQSLALMECMIGTQQLVTLRCPPAAYSAAAERVCEELCRFLARAAEGIYQVDGRGLFAADGTLLVGEE
jgi:hypothetical protein